MKGRKIICRICGKRERTLVVHLNRQHGITTLQYRAEFPGAPIFAPELMKKFLDSGINAKASYWNAFQKLLRECDLETKEQIIDFAEQVSGMQVEDFMG